VPTNAEPSRATHSVAACLRALCLAAVAIAGAACGGAASDPARESAAAGVAPIVARAEAAQSSGDVDGAITGYSAALERTPWNGRLRSQLVAAYTQRAEAKRKKPGGAKGLALAEQDLRSAHELAPDDSTVSRSLAAILIERAAFERDDTLAAQLRAEANQLSPDLAAQNPERRLPVETRIDLAFDLIDRGSIDAGIDQLRAVVREYPSNTKARRLLAQALVRLGTDQTQSRDYDGAAASFSEAVEQYAQMLPCDGQRCDSSELELAHRNRIISAMDAGRVDLARSAYAEAKAIGLSLDDLLQRFPELGPG